jgi:hypothetical protein
MSVSVVNPLNLQKPLFVASILTCLLLCAILTVALSSFWAFTPLLIAALFYSIFRWPVAVIAGVLFFMPFLPLLLLALKASGVPWAQAVSSSKELALLAAAIVLVWRQEFKLEKVDILLIGMFVWAVIISLLQPTSSMWIGLKDDFDFALAFLVGRVIMLSPRWIKTGLWIAGVVAVLGLVEFFFLGIGPRLFLMRISDPADIPVSLKADFFEGVRAGSTLGGPLEFGGFCAVVLLVFAGLYRELPKTYFVLALLIALGLVSSVTRMAGLGLTLGIIFIAVLTGQKLRLAAVTLVCVVLMSAVIIPRMGLQGLFEATLAGQDSSLESHRTSVLEKTRYLLSHPLGLGAGSVGQRAATRDPNALEVESAYLQFGIEYGWLGLSLFIVFCGALFFKLLQADSNFGRASCAVIIAILTMYAFSTIHMEFGLNSWAWVIIGSGVRPRGLTTT